ncbi:AfsR/SARP family transcriptional regulator [Saccharothrix xinjiangensis]|uniref:Tetratricopeptide repeat protein n=1 Tax=Saccharothrix xinjiangensis TaxID=204798 RepID=A0ABV9Y0V8_9PSEU
MATTSRLEFRLLGDIEVLVDSRPVDPGPARQRCVLAALLVDANRVVPVDRLVARVWGDDPPLRARATLHSYLSRLRRILAEPDLLTARRPGYVLAVDPGAVDLHRFRRLVARAREVGDEQALPLLEQALGLWRDQAFALLDAPWLNRLRDTLDRERLDAELDRNDLVLRFGGHAELLPALSARSAEHPLDERLAGQVVLALHHAGRSAQALDQYQRIRRRLAEELGVDPGPALQRLHQLILTTDSDTGTGTLPPVRVHTLPRDVEDFTGRDLERDRLLGTSAALTTIDGMAGIGKTTLAVHVAHLLADRYPDAQLFIDLHAHTADREPTDPATALGVLLRSLGTPAERVPTGVEERAALWRAALAGRRALLVLDNASGSAQVRPLLPGGPGCRVLITSRRRLTDLESARGVSLEVLPHDDAAGLFARVLGEDRAAAEPDAVAEVVRRCGRLPLAIRIAAARLRTRPAWTVAHLAERIRAGSPLAELATGDRSVAAALTLSYQDLPPDRQRLFRSLGLHPGTEVGAHAAAALGDLGVATADRLLEDLVDLHLLHQPAPGRYRCHDLVRAFAARLAADLDTDDDRRAALTRLFDLYLHAAARAMDVIAPREKSRRPDVGAATTTVPAMTDYDGAMAWLELERANLVAVATHAGPDGSDGRAGDLSAILLRYLDLRGHHEDALAVHGHALLTARAGGDRRLEGQALGNLGTVYERLGHYGTAADHHLRALALAEQLDDPALTGRTHNNLGNVHLAVADHREALAHYLRALDLARETGDRTGQSRSANNAGIVHERLGHYDAAVARHREALDLATEVDDVAGRGYALHSLGNAYQRLGRHDEALAHLGQALDLARSTGNRSLEGYAAQGLGYVHLGLGRRAESADHFRRALDLGRDTGNRGLEAEALNGLGDAARADDRPARAVAYHRRALALASETGDRYQQALAHDGLGDALGDTPEAHDHRDRALALYTDLGVPEAGTTGSAGTREQEEAP